MWTYVASAHEALLAVTNGTANAVSQVTEANGGLRVVLFAAVALATIAGLRLAGQAVTSFAAVIKSVLAAGLAIVFVAAAVGLAVVLAITYV
jgi:hypothetical protein